MSSRLVDINIKTVATVNISAGFMFVIDVTVIIVTIVGIVMFYHMNLYFCWVFPRISNVNHEPDVFSGYFQTNTQFLEISHMLFWAEVVVRPTAALLATLSLGEAEVLG